MKYRFAFAGAALLIGLVLAIYPVFAILFGDKHGQSDYVTGLLFVGGVFFFGAGVTGIATRSWKFPLWLVVPSLIVLAEYSQKEPQQMPYHLAVCTALVSGTVAGGVAGSRLRASKRYADSNP